jgi:hypothetical protein
LEYLITDKAIEHCKQHFGDSEKSGSKFNTVVFPNLDIILLSIKSIEPKRIVEQSSGRFAHVYELHGYCGWSGVGKRADYNRIETEIRAGFVTEFAVVESLPQTRLLTVISEFKDGTYTLITVFPGDYAPPFPYDGMLPEEKERAVSFWKENILLKKIN